jgi:hypothetical protein
MSDKLSQRRKIVSITDALLVQMMAAGFIGSYEVIEDGLPPDARIVDVRFSAFSQPGHNTLELLIESAEFEPIEEGQRYPHLNPTFRRTEAAPADDYRKGDFVCRS